MRALHWMALHWPIYLGCLASYFVGWVRGAYIMAKCRDGLCTTPGCKYRKG